MTGSLDFAAVARLAVGICDLVARSSRPDRPFDLVHWIRVCVDDGSADPRQWKPAIAIALLNAPALAAELGVALGPLRQAGGLQSDRTHTADWTEAVACYDPLISDEAAIGYARRCCLYGSPEQVSGQVAELENAGVTTLITTPLAGDTAFSLPYGFIDSMAASGLLAN